LPFDFSLGCKAAFIATLNAKLKAHPIRRGLQECAAGSQEFFRPRSGAEARKNCENPPLANPTPGCARLCIVFGCDYAGLDKGRQTMANGNEHAEMLSRLSRERGHGAADGEQEHQPIIREFRPQNLFGETKVLRLTGRRKS
jgi:hypothetical protein